MEQNAAAENLQVIRTLMERSALYRRTLAPIMTFTGVVGTAAACGAWVIVSARGFVLFWFGVAVFCLLGSLMITRRQALKDAEPFWSPPTRRVIQAILPALFAGLTIGVCVLVVFSRPPIADPPTGSTEMDGMEWLPASWVVLYGCALHAAGFFTPRGLRWFGWVMAFCGLGVFVYVAATDCVQFPWWVSDALMGFFFGVLHLTYGGYLYLTEKRKTAA